MAGGLAVVRGGTMTDAALSGGVQEVGGVGPARADGTIIAAGGKQIVAVEGIASGTSVLSGGTIVFAGGTVNGLSVKSGAAIDLTGLTFSRGGTVQFVENAAHTSGTLTVTEGGTKQTLTLFGQYVAAGFSLSKDANGGTDISYKPMSAAHTPLAAHH
jgi:hypothetical protein